MIRNAIIVVLTLGAVASAVGWVCNSDNKEDVFLKMKSVCCARDVADYYVDGAILFNGNIWFGGMYWPDQSPRLKQIQNGSPIRSGLSRWGIYYRHEICGVEFDCRDQMGLPPLDQKDRFRYQRPPVAFWEIRLPLLPLFFLFASYPTIAFVRGPLRRWRRRRRGRCVKCGYDLTGNVSGVCPECGQIL